MKTTDFANAMAVKKWLVGHGVRGKIVCRRHRLTGMAMSCAQFAGKSGWYWFVGVEPTAFEAAEHWIGTLEDAKNVDLRHEDPKRVVREVPLEPKSVLLMFENAIVWEVDTDGFDYVRETVTGHMTSRSAAITQSSGRVVGYSTLRDDAPAIAESPNRFFRRVFWVAPHDRSESRDGAYAHGGAPTEAVDPRTVRPGVFGKVTDRVLGKHLFSRERKPHG